jgi:hypothetical protein
MTHNLQEAFMATTDRRRHPLDTIIVVDGSRP